MRRIIYALLFFIPFFSIGQHLAEAQYYLDRSDYKKAMAIYSQNQNKAKDTNDISLLVESQNGMADCYIDLGANYKALGLLKQNINLLNSNHNSNYALFAKTHQLLANCYDKLYLLEDYLKESNAFYSYYKKAYPNSEIYKALYYTYLGRYYNMRYLIPKAFYYTNAALKIYHKNKKEAHLIDAYLVYNAHSFTLRNYPRTTQLEKIKYVDSLHYFLNKRFPYDNLKKARIYISVTAMDLDNASFFLNNPDFKNLSKGNYYADKTIAIYNKALAINEKFAGKYYSNSANLNVLKGLLFFYKKDYKSTLENYQLDDNYTISEVKAKPEFFGKTLAELDTIDKYHLTLITIIRKREKRNLIGKKSIIKESVGRPLPETIIQENDILVVYGNNKDIETYCLGQEEHQIRS